MREREWGGGEVILNCLLVPSHIWDQHHKSSFARGNKHESFWIVNLRLLRLRQLSNLKFVAKNIYKNRLQKNRLWFEGSGWCCASNGSYIQFLQRADTFDILLWSTHDDEVAECPTIWKPRWPTEKNGTKGKTTDRTMCARVHCYHSDQSLFHSLFFAIYEFALMSMQWFCYWLLRWMLCMP